MHGSPSCTDTSRGVGRDALSRVTVKGQNREFLGKFTSQYILGEGGVGCISGDGSESAVMLYSYYFYSLLYKFVEILDMDELLYLSPRVNVFISRVGTR